MTARLASLTAAALLAACASSTPPPLEVSDQQRCVVEPRIGSSIPATRCQDRVVAEQSKRDTEQWVDRIRRAPTRSTTGADSGK